MRRTRTDITGHRQTKVQADPGTDTHMYTNTNTEAPWYIHIQGHRQCTHADTKKDTDTHRHTHRDTCMGTYILTY
jgi:hypothetical protein